MKKALTSNELKAFWNRYSRNYVNSFELEDFPIYVNLLNLAKIKEAQANESILELSVGGGEGFKFLIENTKAEKIYGGDLSEEMLSLTRHKISNISHKKAVSLDIINNEDLSRFNDNTFRSIISSMSIHLVNNPSNMLNEIRRCLDKNNKNSSCSLSVWGRPENNFLFNFIPNVMKKHNIQLPNIRSNFHLSKKDKFNNLLLESGYQNIYMEYVSLPLSFTSFDEIDFLITSPLYMGILDEQDEEKRKIIISDLRKDFDSELSSKGRISFEALVVNAKI